VKFHSRFFQSIFAGSILITPERRERERENLRVFRERERERLCSEEDSEECKCDRYELRDVTEGTLC